MKKPLLIAAAALTLAACGNDADALPVWTPADHEKPAERADLSGRAPAQAPAARGEVDLGKTLYALHCASCHGASGRGDGPAAMGLGVPDLAAEATQAKTDGALVEAIRLGGGAMPPFGGAIGVDGMQALIAHLRGFSPAE